MVTYDDASRTLLLFDVDGTLLHSGGAGRRGLTQAFEELFGVPDAFDQVAMSGRTDPLVLDDALRLARLTARTCTRDRFFHRYLEILAQEVLQPGKRKGVMPGVRSLLDRLTVRTDVVCGLVTGNYAGAARIKLDHFGLWNYFVCGSYGDDASDRNALVPVAAARARQLGFYFGAMSDCVIVGDTPFDVQCAAAVGARSVAVATGAFDEDVLRESGADFVLSDLSDTDRLLSLVTESFWNRNCSNFIERRTKGERE